MSESFYLPSARLPVCLSVCLPVCLSACLPVCLSHAFLRAGGQAGRWAGGQVCLSGFCRPPGPLENNSSNTNTH